jgi:hypothetical protein
MYLRCAVYDSPKKWKSWLSLAELWYNTSYHTALGCTPFKALYGYDTNSGISLSGLDSSTSEAALTVQDRVAQMANLKEHLQRAQNKMKVQADRHMSEREFQGRDQVLLKLQPYAQHSVVNRPFPKLAFKYFGPFRVLERVGKATYKLELPEGSMIHPVFLVSQLKPFTPDYSPVFADFKTLVDLSIQDLLPEAVLHRRLVKKGNCAVPQVLVKWTNMPETSATWEDWHVMKTRFPDAVAWGQSTAQAGGDVTPQEECVSADKEAGV